MNNIIALASKAAVGAGLGAAYVRSRQRELNLQSRLSAEEARRQLLETASNVTTNEYAIKLHEASWQLHHDTYELAAAIEDSAGNFKATPYAVTPRAGMDCQDAMKVVARAITTIRAQFNVAMECTELQPHLEQLTGAHTAQLTRTRLKLDQLLDRLNYVFQHTTTSAANASPSDLLAIDYRFQEIKALREGIRNDLASLAKALRTMADGIDLNIQREGLSRIA